MKVNVVERRALCMTCGPVGIKSAGSDRRGGTRWRCAAQVNRYKRSKVETDRQREREAKESAWQQRYGLDAALPCCETVEHFDAPTDRNRFGDLWDEYYVQCRACRTYYIVKIEITDDDDGGLSGVPGAAVADIQFVVAQQTFVNRLADGPIYTAKRAYDDCEAGWREQDGGLTQVN